MDPSGLTRAHIIIQYNVIYFIFLNKQIIIVFDTGFESHEYIDERL